TGKSTLLQHLAWNTKKQIAVCAPTGVAALNVEGQTIHSLFRLPIGLIANGDIDQNDATRKILNAIDTLVIDEISMVNADLMDAIDRSLRQARGRRSEPFGGTQIVMFGDPYQLAPSRLGATRRATSRTLPLLLVLRREGLVGGGRDRRADRHRPARGR
ncbi:hypothetical protein HR12_47300, partial [Microbacterium sp. SUBG005]